MQAAAVSIEQGAAAAAAKLPEVAAGAAREAVAVRDELIPRVRALAWNTHKAGGSFKPKQGGRDISHARPCWSNQQIGKLLEGQEGMLRCSAGACALSSSSTADSTAGFLV